MPSKSPPPLPKEARSPCPVACALDLFGDRWTLLLVRDLMRGSTRYSQFAGAPEGIPTNILADRLVKLEDAKIIKRTPYQQNPPRFEYTLTPKGEALRPILKSLAAWAREHVSGTRVPDGLSLAS